jgi:hypothetical protein
MSAEQPEATRLAELHQECEDWKQGYALLFKETADRRRMNDELLASLQEARAFIALQTASFVETATNPTSGLIEHSGDLLTAESDQDLLNSIDAVITKATGETK